MTDTDLLTDAAWIWPDAATPADNAYALLRGTFELDEASALEPEAFTLEVAASSRYRLLVNGRFVGDGPPPAAPPMTYVDRRAIGAHLRPGRNVIAFIVYYIGQRTAQQPPGLAATVRDASGAVCLATGPHWQAMPGRAWRTGSLYFGLNRFDPYQEFHDARLMPAGWAVAEDNDDAWAAAVVRPASEIERRLHPRPIPFLGETPVCPAKVLRVEECTALANRHRPDDLSIALSMNGQPLRFARVTDIDTLCTADGVAAVPCSTEHLGDRSFDGIREPTVLLDFGRIITAHVELELTAPAGATSDMGVSERLIDGHFNNALEGPFCFRYTAREGPQTWRSHSWRAFRYLKLRFHDCFEPVQLHRVQAIDLAYPFDRQATFDADDATLRGVYDICRRTIELCSSESLVDTPWREQAQWLGDVAAVTLAGIHACFGDETLPRKFLQQSAQTQRPDGLLAMITNAPLADPSRNIPDYSRWWVIALEDHHRYAGDEALLRELFPVVPGILDAFARHTDDAGLVRDMPGWVFIDWASIDRDGACGPLNALVYGALASAVRMATLLGDAANGARWRQWQTRIREAYHEHFFDPERGLFVDAHAHGRLSTAISEHGNFAPICWGLCDKALATRIVRMLLDEPHPDVTEAQPFWCRVVLDALGRLGETERARRLIRERWGRRMLDRGASSCYEEWGINGSWRDGVYRGFMRSQSHAWSAYAASWLLHHLAGFEVLEPGCGRVRVAPRQVGFDYALSLPLPQGDLEVTCRHGEVTCTAPDGVTLDLEQRGRRMASTRPRS